MSTEPEGYLDRPVSEVPELEYLRCRVDTFEKLVARHNQELEFVRDERDLYRRERNELRVALNNFMSAFTALKELAK